MSSGVDQLKLSGNAAKSVEERDIPWSQQVDEASYENLAATNNEDNSGISQINMKFQNPPFNIKENQNISWNSCKTRKSIGNLDLNKKYGKTLYQSNLKRDEVQSNHWNLHTSKRSISDNFSGNIIRENRQEETSTVNVDNTTAIDNTYDVKKISISTSNGAQKKTTWASIASQPAKNVSKMNLLSSSHKKKGPGMPPPPMVPGKHDLDVNAWDAPNNNPPLVPTPPIIIDISFAENSSESIICSSARDIGYYNDKEHKVNDFIKEENRSNYNNSSFGRQRSSPNGHSRKSWNVQHPMPVQHRQPNFGVSTHSKRNEFNRKIQYNSPRTEHETSLEYRDENNPRNEDISRNMTETVNDSSQAVLDELRDKNNYNPPELDLEIAKSARFFVIKSYSEDDIHRSIKYEIWCSTDHGNKRLDDAFKERKKEGGNILLFFSVNGSGHFCGVAQMITAVDYNSTSTVWSQDKWKGKFKVKWIYVKDVPNGKLRHIRLENNENKAVTHSRDTQEVPNAKGIEVLQILHAYKHATSIFDDFYHYEKKQEEEVSSKRPSAADNSTVIQNQFQISRNYHKQQEEWNRDRESRSSTKFSGVNYRERNRSNYTNSFNDFRENTEKTGRYSQKPDASIRREHVRLVSKQGNRDRDLSEEKNNIETRFHSG